MEKAIQEKIQRLQLIEENLHSHLNQKQQVQSQLLELESANDALTDAKGSFRIVGNIMVEKPASELKTELGERMERLKVRVTAFERQEQKLKEQAESLQQEIMKSMKGDGHGDVQ